jgi:hypothetical protein
LLRHVPTKNAATPACSSPDRPDAARLAAEALIERRYAQCYEARIAAHYPDLYSVYGRDGLPRATAGMRAAASGPLFLEAYLAEPIEAVLARHFAADVPRAAVVEIGSLASCSRTASVRLFRSLADHLNDAGFRYAVVTATSALRSIMATFGFEWVELADADPARLSDGGASWGQYYDTQPRVMAGEIGRNAERLTAFIQSHLAQQGNP